MKLIRFGEPGQEKPGVLLKDGSRIDASALGSDYDEAFFGSGGLSKLDSSDSTIGITRRKLRPRRRRNQFCSSRQPRP